MIMSSCTCMPPSGSHRRHGRSYSCSYHHPQMPSKVKLTANYFALLLISSRRLLKLCDFASYKGWISAYHKWGSVVCSHWAGIDMAVWTTLVLAVACSNSNTHQEQRYGTTEEEPCQRCSTWSDMITWQTIIMPPLEYWGSDRRTTHYKPVGGQALTIMMKHYYDVRTSPAIQILLQLFTASADATIRPERCDIMPNSSLRNAARALNPLTSHHWQHHKMFKMCSYSRDCRDNSVRYAWHMSASTHGGGSFCELTWSWCIGSWPSLSVVVMQGFGSSDLLRALSPTRQKHARSFWSEAGWRTRKRWTSLVEQRSLRSP